MKIYFFACFLLLFLSTSSMTLEECQEKGEQCRNNCVRMSPERPQDFVRCFDNCARWFKCSELNNQ